MLGLFNRLRHQFAPAPRARLGEPCARAYAVGDVHGRLDLLEDLLEAIEADVAARPRKPTYIVFLGDLVDRGPDSAGVVERLRTWRPEEVQPVFLAGNHEEMLLRMLDGEEGILRRWLEFGGAECVESYGLNRELLLTLSERRALERLRLAVPQVHEDFLRSFRDTFRFGDYLFVHAGIKPGVPVEQQTSVDLRWIREPFLTDSTEHGFVVVHGHTIVDGVEERANRIGIDTGAYRSGTLTALAIEDDMRWYLSAQEGLRSGRAQGGGGDAERAGL